MRTAFIEALCTAASASPNLWLVCGDLGFSVLEVFHRRFPERFVNAGVAEQNMMGVAAGLAQAGKTVFVYSIANFPVVRCLEQVRNDVCYHSLDVKIVAVGGGVAYGPAGYSHHAVEDLAILRVLPNLDVLAPGDPWETRLAVAAVATTGRPAYLRLGKAGEEIVHKEPPPFAIGRAIPLLDGCDIAIIATGCILPEARRAADMLAERGIAATLLSMPTVQPLDEAAIAAASLRTRRILTVEEHGRGGLGAAVGEAIARQGLGVSFASLRLPDEVVCTVLGQASARKKHGIDAEGITRAALALVARGE